MENATTALYIAAGTLLGVMILSIVVFYFRRVGSLHEERDRIMTAEQIAEWNNEYLAYDKKLMYGTDLISVLNKATSNNEKYVEGKGFLSGDKYTKDYLINIKFKLKSDLEDTIVVTYINEGTGKETEYVTNDGPISDSTYTIPTLCDAFENYDVDKLYKGNDSNSINTNIIPNGSNATELKSYTYPSVFKKDNEYNLLSNNSDNPVTKLMKLSNKMTMVATNSKDNKSIHYTINNMGVQTREYKGWYKVTWKTCLNDLKSRKFKCTEVKYDTSSEQTGRIVEMQFEELGIH